MKVQWQVTTPDDVQTRIGTLKSFDGLRDPETVQKVHDNLDFTCDPAWKSDPLRRGIGVQN